METEVKESQGVRNIRFLASECREDAAASVAFAEKCEADAVEARRRAAVSIAVADEYEAILAAAT